MNHFIWRIMAGVLLAVATVALSANAQAVANPNQQNPDKKQQNNPADQNKSQAQPNDRQPNANGPSDKSAAKDPAAATQQLDKKQGERDAKNPQSPANQKNQTNPAQANPNAAAPQNAAQGSNQQESNQNQTNQQKAADNSRQSSSAREHTAMRPTDMRGPDIGLWFNRSSRDGLVISDISTRGPIAQLGFHEGDRIVSVNGRRISGEPEFINYLLTSDADRVAVIVTRNGRDETIYVEPSALTEGYGYIQVEPLERFGVVLDDRYDDRIVIWRVIPRSPAYYAGLREGDIVSSLSGRPYTNRRDFEESVRDLKAGEASVKVRRGDRDRDLTVDVPEYESQAGNAERGVGGTDLHSPDQRGADRNNQSNRDQGNQRDNKDQNSNDRNDNPRPGSHNTPNPPNMTGGNVGGGAGERRENR